ncbi:MAG: ABC transporter ATP-binding protein/permease [Oscillospiraceae bacterium]
MLTLKNITKDYTAGDTVVSALRGIDVSFGEGEFVAILGPSGCGKTTLLNIIGGLDHYTEGDLIINGRSTRDFEDRDWDTYRNHSIGFVFQTYNLIPHQTVLANVELALTISGVSKQERRSRAEKVLADVGLADQLNKRPNQMSGGQMQRVAIARALINDPDILLADEPTGALDSETSLQIMELLSKIAKDKLVIMVTHNPDLAERYSTRIVRLLDGKIIDDTLPCNAAEETVYKADGKKKPSMSFGTALSLSLNNLMTKKARTILTAFAGSIGIIGIALILSLSNGIQMYIDRVQGDTLSSYPITIEAEAPDLTSLISTMSDTHDTAAGGPAHEKDAVYSTVILYDLLNSLTSMDTETNDLEAFKKYLDDPDCPLRQYTSAIQYGYNLDFNIFTEDKDGAIVKTDAIELLQNLMTGMYGGDYSSYFSSMGSMFSSYQVWEEMLPGENGELISDTLPGQYDMVYGRWPEASDEVVLFVDKNNEVSDLVLYALGLKTNSEMTEALEKSMNKEQVDSTVESWSYEDICAHTFKLILPSEYYRFDELSKSYVDVSSTASGLDYLYNSANIGTPLKIVGVARQGEDAISGMMQGAIGYTSALTEHAIKSTAESDIVKAQREDPATDVISALPFRTKDTKDPSGEEKITAVREYISGLEATDKAALYTEIMSVPSDAYVNTLIDDNMSKMTREYIEELLTDSYAEEMGVDPATVTDYIADMDDATLFAYVRESMAEQIRAQYAEATKAKLSNVSAGQLAMVLDHAQLENWQYDYIFENSLPATVSDGSFDDNMKLFGYTDLARPSSVNLYASTFENKDAIADEISAYNDAAADEQQLSYTDYVAILMSSITTIISAISYVLIAFVAISLVVSSIMIGIITYISVLERTKEIGILRAIGASKRDISNVFNAEALIEGFTSGVIGIGLSLLLLLPINAIIHHLTDIYTLNAALPAVGGFTLIAISMILTFIAGLIPSGFAARRDPVEALRTE